MGPEQSWNLLCQKVFVHQGRVPPQLVCIGKEIARSCGGLPLSIVVVAGLLSTLCKTLNSWEDVARNIRSSLAKAHGKIVENILSLSYSHLPQHLRPCFLFMGGFPEDHEIKAINLMRRWIAESFVKPVVSKEFEDTAEEYLEDLVDRSLIVVTKRKSNGKIKHCSLHDMVRDMCIKLSHEDKFLEQIKGRRARELLISMKDQRRISIFCSDLNSFSNIYSSTLRTIIYCQDEIGSSGSFRLLRVLDLLTARRCPDMLCDQVFKLFHLRYLALWYSYTVPTSISNLQCLQTLIIKVISDKRLPYEIWNMHQLRHLIISSCLIPDTDADTRALENLQTLRVKNLRCSISMLNLIPNLTKLWLKYSMGSGELLLHNLVRLSRLEKLHLELGYDWSSSGKPNLVVPSSLKKLTLTGWGRGGEPYLEIVGPFPNLEVLKFKNFDFKLEKWRTTDEDFPQLRFLLIEKSNLSEWETESSHFPRLKSLFIVSCLYLSEIPECIGEIPTLELIELNRCQKSLVESTKRIQEKAQSYYGDAFEVRCIGCTPIDEVMLLLERYSGSWYSK